MIHSAGSGTTRAAERGGANPAGRERRVMRGRVSR
jgi:hypothetical protein